MTAAARTVLADCVAVLDMLEVEEDEQRWRVLWAGAMALVRAIGHVLRKVDGEDAMVRPRIDEAWNRWRADRSTHAVFWESIEQERNRVPVQRFGLRRGGRRSGGIQRRARVRARGGARGVNRRRTLTPPCV